MATNLDDYIDEALISALPLPALEKLEAAARENRADEVFLEQLFDEYQIDVAKITAAATEAFNIENKGEENDA